MTLRIAGIARIGIVSSFLMVACSSDEPATPSGSGGAGTSAGGMANAGTATGGGGSPNGGGTTTTGGTNGAGAANRGEQSVVAIAECRHGATPTAGDQRARDILPLLLGDRRHSRKHRAIGSRGRGSVADYEHIGVARHR